MNELPGWLKHSTVWLLLALGVFMAIQTWQARGRAWHGSANTEAA